MRTRGLSFVLAAATISWCLSSTAREASIRVEGVSVENANAPLGIDVSKPRFSWVLAAAERNQAQAHYQIRVASSPEKLQAPDIWDSGKVASRQSQYLSYDGPALHSRSRYYWAVKVWDGQGAASPWSRPSSWEMGLIGDSDWKAKWIGRGGFIPLPPNIIKSQLPATPSPLKPGEVQGQTFTTDHPIASVSAEVPTFGTTHTAFTLSLYKNGPGGELLTRQRIENHLDNDWATLKLGQPLPPGKYYLEQSDISGKAGWYTYPASKYAFGDAIAGKISVPGDRKTKWEISGPVQPDGLTSQLRREFQTSKPILQARLYITALGIYQARINGQRVGADYFAPGWTDYNKRIQYQTYDVTKLIRTGQNAVAVDLAPGWYAGHVGSLGPNQYGQLPYLRAQLELRYADQSVELVSTDEKWKSALGAVVSSDLIMGEKVDARLATPGWDQPRFNEAGWKPVLVNTEVKTTLVAQKDPPIQADMEIKPIRVTRTKSGAYLYDMGQNMVGIVRMSTKGKAGQIVTLRYAEVLSQDGTLYVDNLRSAKATDRFILNGRGTETFEPAFTFHGFRYVEVSGSEHQPEVIGRVLRTAMPLTMRFATDIPMLNQLQQNIVWGQRGNFLSVPMDTPARDERLGWTGDIAAFVGTAAYNMQTLPFLSKWLTDLRDTQNAEGAFADVAPTLQGLGSANAGWGDAGVSVPWTLFERYGDKRILEQNFEAMTRWVAYLEKNSTAFLRPANGYGDWLNVDDETPKDLISTAFFADSANTVGKVAKALNRDSSAYENLFSKVKSAFVRAYVSPDGRLKGDTQTAYALALTMDLLPENLRKPAADRLVELIKSKNWHLSTGFLGTPRLLHALSDTGHADVAYRLLLQKSWPSWGYQIEKGATTMWERWDGIRPDGSFQDKSMNSFNHYAYGSVGEWMYQNIAGLSPLSPGFQQFMVKPVLGGNIHTMTASYRTGYGTIDVNWAKKNGKLDLSVSVPVNTSAEIWVPAQGGKVRSDAASLVRTQAGYSIFQAGSGKYRFTTE